jgi:hypothetical protein
MREAPSCIRVFVRISAGVRPGETPDEAIERLLPQAIEEIRAKASACGLLPGDAEVEHHLEIETCRVDEDEVEVRVALFDKAAVQRAEGPKTHLPSRLRRESA